MRAQRREIVLVQLGAQPQLLGQLGEALQRGALVAGHAGHGDEGARVAGEGPRVDHGAASSAAGSVSSSAMVCMRRTALVSARA